MSQHLDPDLRGIITVLNTPFTSENAIDQAGLRANVEHAIDAGVAGFLVPAMASEVDHLTVAEKNQIVGAVVDQTAGRVTVIGGASAGTRAERMALAQMHLHSGCDGVLVQLTAEMNASEMECDLYELTTLQPRILMLQDWDATGSGIPIPTLLTLFERIERFNWLKVEVADAGPKYTEVLRRTNGRLNVAGGWAVTQMIDGLDRGVHAFMPTAMHRVYTEIYRRYSRGDRPAAQSLFDTIKPVLAFSNQNLEVSIRFFKRMLHAQGIYATANVRLPGTALTPEQQLQADAVIEKILHLQPTLGAA